VPGRNVNGTTLEVLERGTGDSLVLVHGSASDHRTWTAQLERFSEHYRVIAYSRRYHWPNQPIPADADYAMLEHADDLHALLREVSPSPVHLMGHSYGAFVALCLAIRAPGLVRTLVLAEPPVITLFVSNQPRPAEIFRLLVRRPRTAIALIRFGATGMAPATKLARRGDAVAAMHTFGRAVLGRAFHDRLSPERREQVEANAFVAEFLGSGFPPLDDAAVRNVNVPTLLLAGEHSPALFPRLLDRLEELLPRTERAVIPKASHILHEDNPAAYNAAVLSFLSKAAGR
jgi:pimeloyl-ACP methyl ester carboxylesterase